MKPVRFRLAHQKKMAILSPLIMEYLSAIKIEPIRSGLLDLHSVRVVLSRRLISTLSNALVK